MKTLLLYGGTFDPPHNGHIQLLQSAIAATNPDKVVVMPAGIPPHKKDSTTPAALRLAMCGCFLSLHKNLVISDWETTQKQKNYTVDTVHWLCKQYPDTKILLCVGSDMLLSFETWREWQWLLQHTILVAHSRKNGDESALLAAKQRLEQAGGQVVFTHGDVLEASSSGLRAGKESETLLPPQALRVIEQNRLYQAEKTETLVWAQALAQDTLSPKRFAHTLNVKASAESLATRYGASPFKAALAALLHDIAKELPTQKLLQILADDAIIAGNASAMPSAVLHGYAAAQLAITQWGITDAEVLGAIRYHTTGRPGMTTLDKIIYLADMICAERDYPEVHELRHWAEQDLNVAAYWAVRRNLEWMEICGKSIDPISKLALDDLQEHVLRQQKTQ